MFLVKKRVRRLASPELILAVLTVCSSLPQHARAGDEGTDGQFTAGLGTLLPAPPPASLTPANTVAPRSVAPWFRKVYAQFLLAPLPGKIFSQGGMPVVVPTLESDPNPLGRLQTYNPDGPTPAQGSAANAFFVSFGTNGRTCVTCHLPPDGMGLSIRTVNATLKNAGPNHPLFAPVDGANCPNQVKASDTSGSLYKGLRGKGAKDFKSSHSLLLNKGLIRIFLAVPESAEYKLEVVRDPTTCNTDPDYNGGVTANQSGEIFPKVVSVYRRPRISTNLNLSITPQNANRSIDCAALGTQPLKGNIMWDGREANLCTQALGATLGHAQAISEPSAADLTEMVAFETNIYSAQIRVRGAGRTDQGGATGGAVNLSTHDVGTDPSTNPGFPPFPPPFDEFTAWGDSNDAARRQSIARGQHIFNNRTFFISDVEGFNNLVGRNPALGTCASCHSVFHNGANSFGNAQQDIGTGGQAVGLGGPPPANDLPLFRITCNQPGKFYWDHSGTVTQVETNDPGRALISGKCEDVGTKTAAPLRALAAREPYFSDGSAATLLDVINFYDKRFSIGFSPQEKADLVAFLSAL